MSHMKCLLKCHYSKKSVLSQKILGCVPVTFILIFHPNFHTNVLSHVFYMRYKIVCTYKYLHQKLVNVTLKKIYILFLFINIGFVTVILKKIKIIFIHNYFCVAKFPKDIFPIVPISVIMPISLKLHQTSTIPDSLRLGSQSRKFQEMREWKQRIQKLR